jgi:putative ABC transport system ATP-binding protein
MYLQATDITKRFERNGHTVIAIEGVSFALDAGDLVGLQGPSGSGKSTLLNIIGGLERPTDGEVIVAGTRLNDLSDTELARYRRSTVGFVFQSAHLLGSLTVFENVMLPLIPIPGPEAEKTSRVHEALETVNIAHRADHLPAELSGGEQARAAVARAIVNNPHVLLADEPTGELDRNNADNILALLGGLNDEGCTVIIASHDEPTLAVTRRKLLLDAGHLQAEA